MGQPLILVSNDDGIDSRGIRKLVEVMQHLGEVVHEFRRFGRCRDPVFSLECLGHGKVFQFVQAFVFRRGHACRHAICSLAVAAQGTCIKPCMVLVRVPHVRAQPCRLLMTEVRQPVIAGFGLGMCVGLAVADKSDVGHGCLLVPLALF